MQEQRHLGGLSGVRVTVTGTIQRGGRRGVEGWRPGLFWWLDSGWNDKRQPLTISFFSNNTIHLTIHD